MFFSKLASVIKALVTKLAKNISMFKPLIAIFTSLVLREMKKQKKDKGRRLSKEKTKRSREKTKRSREKTKRRLISEKLKATKRSPDGMSVNTDSFKDGITKRLDDKNEVVIEQEFLWHGSTGKRLLRKPKTESVQDRLEGNYLILTVDSGNVRKGFRVIVRNVDSGDEIKVAIPTGKLSDSQLAQLKNSEWLKSELYMQINIERIEDRIHNATLICVGLSDDT